MDEISVLQPPTSSSSPPIIKKKSISKPANQSNPPKPENPTNFNHIEYFNEFKEKLPQYKLPELREITKLHKIKGSKNKQDYINKIHEYFVKYVNAIKIQRMCRGFFVRFFFKVKGDIAKSSNYVNETDFYTLEPLNEIDFKKLFVFKEDNTFYYGFNVNSLISMYKKNNTILNPYNRKLLPIETIQNIFSHYQLLSILFKENAIGEDSIENITTFKIPRRHQIETLFRPKTSRGVSDQPPDSAISPSRELLNTLFDSVVRRRNNVLTLPIERVIQNLMSENVFLTEDTDMTIIGIPEFSGFLTPPPPFLPPSSMTLSPIESPSYSPHYEDERTELENTRRKMTIFKQQPLNTRINELFMYIDQLGNYTNATWFSTLNKRKCYIFYSHLRELWAYRGQIPITVKNKICPLGDPFLASYATYSKRYDDITDDEIRLASLDVIENIIMTSLDIEYRKIGCLHVLTALTGVSSEAREQYGFLV